jgi:Raf kinase inhibitor-like YbhB/YbcL family protein
MRIVDEIVQKLGPVLRPFHAGVEKLASHAVSAPGAATIRVESDAFADGAPLPRRFAQEGGDVSPPLRWSNVPPGTRELAVLCEDPDAPAPKPYAHWVVCGLMPSVTSLPENVEKVVSPRDERMEQGTNSAQRVGYVGAAPPPGHGLHHYHFQVFALDVPLRFEHPPTRDELVEAMSSHVLAYGEVVATYERS